MIVTVAVNFTQNKKSNGIYFKNNSITFLSDQ